MKMKLFLPRALQSFALAFRLKKLERSNSMHSRIQGCIRAACLLAPLLLSAPAAAQAQFNYVVTNGAVTITGYTGPGGSVIIPDLIDGLPVTCIGHQAFYLQRTLTDIMIPKSVVVIEDHAFTTCTSLTNLSLGSGVASIGSSAFGSCSSLASLSIPNSVTNIGDWAFAGCEHVPFLPEPDQCHHPRQRYKYRWLRVHSVHRAQENYHCQQRQ